MAHMICATYCACSIRYMTHPSKDNRLVAIIGRTFWVVIVSALIVSYSLFVMAVMKGGNIIAVSMVKISVPKYIMIVQEWCSHDHFMPTVNMI